MHTLLLKIDLDTIVNRFLAPLILGGIATGVLAKYVYDHWVHYTRARDKTKVTWDWKGFFLTFIVSWFIAILFYGGVFNQVRQLGDKVLVFAVAAQAGFFWQSVIGELGKKFSD